MNQLLLVAGGGAVGSALRYLVSSGMHQWLGRAFPYGTLAVNVVGGLLMGGLYVLLVERPAQSAAGWQALLLVGVLGGFTTFSAFSIETVRLIETGAVVRASTNIIANVVLCCAACWLGLWLARQL